MKFMPKLSAEARFLFRVLCVVLAVAFCYLAVIVEVCTLVFNATPRHLERAGQIAAGGTTLWSPPAAVLDFRHPRGMPEFCDLSRVGGGVSDRH
jgi:hypothetical protein